MPAARALAAVTLAAALAAALAVPGAAAAQSSAAAATGFYGGLTVRQEGSEQGLTFGNAAASFARFAPLDVEPATRTSAFGGYRFRNDLALEASIASTSGYRLPGRGGVGLLLPGDAGAGARHWHVDVVGSWSFWRSLSLYGRLGYAQSELAPVYRTSIAGGERQAGDGLQYGVGLRYDFSRALGLKLEYARVPAGEFERGFLPDGGELQFGVQYRF